MERFKYDSGFFFIKNCVYDKYGQPLEIRPHLYFVDFTSHTLFYIMTSLPAFIKVGKTPATQNLVLEQYAVKIGNSTLFLYDNYINLP